MSGSGFQGSDPRPPKPKTQNPRSASGDPGHGRALNEVALADEEDDDQKKANQNFHGSRVRYGRLGKVGMNAQFFQQTSQGRAKQVVQDCRKPELLMHRESVVSLPSSASRQPSGRQLPIFSQGFALADDW